MAQFKVTATAPTHYQLASLKSFGMAVKKLDYGSYHSEQKFDSEEEAKAYLTKRAKIFYKDFEDQNVKQIANIETNGFLTFDGVTAHIKEVEDFGDELFSLINSRVVKDAD